MSHNPYTPPVARSKPTMPKAPPGASLALGLSIFGMIAWLVPLVGFPVTIWALVRGSKALSGPDQAMAVVAVVLSSIGLLLTVLNAGFGVYLTVTGQNALFNQLQGK